MKKDYTHICIVLDASGSMECIENDIKGSFNTFLNKQREEQGKTVFDLFQFSDEVERLVKSADLALFKDDLMAEYTCSGMTALNDGVCIAIDTMGKEFAVMPEDERPENVLCVIITDGQENASKEFTADDVKKRIEHQQDVYKWEFLFLAANQDAFETGAGFGLSDSHCANFTTTPAGVREMYCMALGLASCVRKRNIHACTTTDSDHNLIAKYLQEGDDETMVKALKIVVMERNASTSYLQRKLKISYNKAAELLETMEKRGIVGPLADNGKREILADNPGKETENQAE